MSEALKACPWCHFNGEAIIGTDPRPGLRACRNIEGSRSQNWWIECDNCLCNGPTESNEAKARAAWNRRADATDMAALRAWRDEFLSVLHTLREATMRGYSNQDDAVKCERGLSALLYRLDGIIGPK